MRGIKKRIGQKLVTGVDSYIIEDADNDAAPIHFCLRQ